MVSVPQALILSFVMGAVIFFCRLFPFLFFRRTGGSGAKTFLSLVEKTAPPVAMTVLAFNAISGPIREHIHAGIPVLTASAFTALVHLWKRNSLISISGGTLLYMILSRILP
jgi:branched-subunit amino acid transport protein AzlD